MSTTTTYDLLYAILQEDGEMSDAYGEMINAYKRRFADRTLPELGVLLQRVKDRIEEVEAELNSDRPDNEAMEVYEESVKRWFVQLVAKRTAIDALIDLDERGLREVEVFLTETQREHLETVAGAYEEHWRSITSMNDLIKYAGETPMKQAQRVLRKTGVEYQHRNPDDFAQVLRQVIDADQSVR